MPYQAQNENHRPHIVKLVLNFFVVSVNLFHCMVIELKALMAALDGQPDNPVGRNQDFVTKNEIFFIYRLALRVL
jgi:hypothetical protein